MSVPGVAPGYDAPPYYGAPSPEQETQALRTQAESLEVTLDEIRKRIAELEATQEKDS